MLMSYDIEPFLSQASLFATSMKKSAQLIELALAIPTALIIWRVYGLKRMVVYLLGFAMAVFVQRTFLSAMMLKTGQKQASAADVLSLSRAGTGAVLAGIVTSGIRDRRGSAGWIGWLMVLLGATDWLDGSLARRIGPTQLGGVLDIEADSWLTLWSAAGAVAWSDLPSMCLLPPILRYLDPLFSLHHGNLPRGGGPWWARLAGFAQMGLLFVALAPFNARWRNRVLTIAAVPVSAGQCAALLLLLAQNRLEQTAQY